MTYKKVCFVASEELASSLSKELVFDSKGFYNYWKNGLEKVIEMIKVETSIEFDDWYNRNVYIDEEGYEFDIMDVGFDKKSKEVSLLLY